jgi:hypothetical protein
MLTETVKYLAFNFLAHVLILVIVFAVIKHFQPSKEELEERRQNFEQRLQEIEQERKQQEEEKKKPRPGFNCPIPMGSVFPTIKNRNDLYNAVNHYLRGNSKGYVPISQWFSRRGEIEHIHDMSYLFEGLITTKFQNDAMVGIENWNVGKVMNMYGMFLDCSAFNQPLSRWAVLSVEDASFLFCGCYSFNQQLTGAWERIGSMNKIRSFRKKFPGTKVIGVYYQTNVDKKKQKWYMDARESDCTHTFRFPQESYPNLYNPRLY